MVTVFLLAAYIIVYGFSIIGNSLVCYVIVRYPRIRNTTNLLLLSLALADLLSSTSGCIVLSFQYKYRSNSNFTGNENVHPTGAEGDALCRALTSGTISYIAIQISELTLMVIAVDRYFSICFPLKSKLRIKKHQLKYIVPTLWIFGTVTYSQYIVVTISGEKGLPCEDNYPSDTTGKIIATVDFTMYCAIPLLIFTFCYCSILKAIWRPKISDALDRTCRRRKTQLKTTRILFTVTFFFCICVVPNYMDLLVQVYSAHAYELEYSVWLFLLHMHAAVTDLKHI